MDQQAYLHSSVHERLRAQFSEIGLDLTELIPQSWEECGGSRSGRHRVALAHWTSAVRLVDRVYAHGGLPEIDILIHQMLGTFVVPKMQATDEARLWEEILDLPAGRLAFSRQPSLPYRIRFGRVTGLAAARVKSPEGMVRRYLLKGSNAARLDALAAWVVVGAEYRNGRWQVPDAVVKSILRMRYKLVGHLKTASSGSDYDALTFQRTRTVNGVELGEELKVFSTRQFAASEVDPCHDGARGRYERRRTLELAAKLGFPHTRLHLVRHGPTAANVAGVLNGWTCSPLLAEAADEAHWAGNAFAADLDELPAKIFCSNSPRAILTCEKFAPPLRAPVIHRIQYRERNFGQFEGRPRPDGQSGHVFFGTFDLETPMPGGGESLKTMASRVLAAAIIDVDDNAGDGVLLITHAGPMRVLLGGIDGVDPRLWWDLPAPEHLKPISRLVPTGYLSRVLEGLTRSVPTSLVGTVPESIAA